MTAAAVTLDELLRHNEEETEHWHRWFQQNPDALEVPLDVADMKNVRGMLLHIFAVELLYSERIVGVQRARLSYDDFPSGSVDELFGIAAQARAKFREMLDQFSDAGWNEQVVFVTKTAGNLGGSRRKCFVHVLLHSMRHWAQLATALRQHGFKQDWMHDFLLTKVMA